MNNLHSIPYCEITLELLNECIKSQEKYKELLKIVDDFRKTRSIGGNLIILSRYHFNKLMNE